jgi:NitT/TauT family transport system substrate-binding protein
MSKIRAPILLAAMSVLTGFAFFGNRVAAQDVVRVGVGVDPVYTAWWVAADKGFFAKRNLNVTLRQYSGGPDLADSVMAGEQDFGASGTATWMPRFVRSDALIIVARMGTSPSARSRRRPGVLLLGAVAIESGGGFG